MGKSFENVALFDLDGTLCDYSGGLLRELESMRSPSERAITEVPHGNNVPSYLRARMGYIQIMAEWWTGLKKLELGFDIWMLAEKLSYQRMILTQGPKRNPYAWAGKKMWIDKNLGPDTNITITRDKSLVYGRVLVDDWPPYITNWLKWRPRGLVIMPVNKFNADFTHNQVIRYDGKNYAEVQERMEAAKYQDKKQD